MTVGFYGRLVPATNVGNVERSNGGSPETWTDVSHLFTTIAAPSTSLSRTLEVRTRAVGYPARRFPVVPGRYRVVQGSGSRTLRAADTLVSGTAPAAAAFAYYFCVVKDCFVPNEPPLPDSPPDGVPDNTSCTTFPSSCTACNGDVCTVPPMDGCVADVTSSESPGTPDGGVDIKDLLYYLAAFEAGTPNADVADSSQTTDPCVGVDGGVDINDLLCFLGHFEAGC